MIDSHDMIEMKWSLISCFLIAVFHSERINGAPFHAVVGGKIMEIETEKVKRNYQR